MVDLKKKQLTLSLQYGHVILVSGYLVLTGVNCPISNMYGPMVAPLVLFGIPFRWNSDLVVPFLVLRASLCKILISSFGPEIDFAHYFSVDFFK